MATQGGSARWVRLRSGHGAALLGYVVLTVGFMWPAVVHFRTRPLLGTGDGSFFYWAWWAMPQAIRQGHNPFQTDLLFHPVGADLRLSTTAPLVSLVTLPVRLVAGPVAQVNFSQLLAAWLAAVGGYLLIDRVTAHRGAAFIGGAAFSFSAYRFMHAPGHLNLVHTAFLPFGALLLLRFVDEPTRWRAAALGALVGAAFLTDPQIAILTITCLLPVAVHHRTSLRRHSGPLAGASILAVMVAAPLLLPMIAAAHAGEGTAPDQAEAMVSYSSDPTRWVVPPVDHPVLGGLAERVADAPRPEGVAYPGLVIVGLAIAGAHLRVPGRRVWIAVFAIGFVLSLGPYLSYPRGYYDVPLPYLALRQVPLLSQMRAPGRFALVAGLAIVVLAMQALAHLARRRPAWVYGVGVVLLFELMPGYQPVQSASAPPAYRTIAADDGDAAVLEVPLQWSTGDEFIGDLVAGRDDGVFLEYATFHGHPLVNGRGSRYPDRRLDALLEIDVYQEVLSLQGDPGYDDPATFGRGDLVQLGIGFVVYHRDRPMPAVLRYVQSLHLTVLADDGTVIVWGVT